MIMDLNLRQIYMARKNLEGVVFPVPLTLSRGLSRISGGRVYLKWENLQKTGSFKIRGAVHKMLTLGREKLSVGVITASAGNHAQGVAYGAGVLGVPVTAVMPVSTPRVKIVKTEDLGARVILFGENYDEAHARCLELAERDGMVYLPAFEDYGIMAGHGTIALEILEALPETDTVLVPVGGGGLISGIAVAVKAIHPGIRVIGVQSSRACTMFRCLEAGRIVPVPVLPTLAEGLAGGIDQISFEIVRHSVDDMVLADEEGLEEAIRWALTEERQVVEASGAVGIAAILQGRVPGLEGQRVVVVVSGGNIDRALLGHVLSSGARTQKG
ncbi:MAG: threonine/serine dehydratase [Deltaproteobacteria bacterium]|nr:threonine/serine dehydratase [Deltaproteobacteria bacterium]